MGQSTEKLVSALVEAGAPPALVARAEAGEFHDFDSQSPTPITDLVAACRAHGLHTIAQRAIEGAFDATAEEAIAWLKSPEGRAIMRVMRIRVNDAAD